MQEQARIVLEHQTETPSRSLSLVHSTLVYGIQQVKCVSKLKYKINTIQCRLQEQAKILLEHQPEPPTVHVTWDLGIRQVK